jgi:monoamine oxidase
MLLTQMSGYRKMAIQRDSSTIIIIGGGVAGLVAAKQLSSVYNVIILEALPRFGGRIWTINNHEWPSAIEGGAEFIHGKGTQTIELLNEAGIGVVTVEGKPYQSQRNSQEVEEDDDEQWAELLERMSAVLQDSTLQQFLESHFNDEKYARLRSRAISYAGGFDLADKDRVSVKSLFREWVQHNEDRRVEGGYGRLIDYLVTCCEKEGCKLISNTLVKEIIWREGHVEIITEDQSLYHADRCLVTVSLAVLQNRRLKFDPPIAEYLEAAGKIGFGNVIKFILSFNRKIWHDDAGFFLSGEIIPTWWTQLPENNCILTGWAGGPSAAGIGTLNDKELIEKALVSLSAILHLDVREIKDSLLNYHIFNWEKEPSVLGAYSYVTPETSGAQKLLSKPIRNTIYFAGEALYSGPDPGTVEAAIVSAQYSVKRLTDTI